MSDGTYTNEDGEELPLPEGFMPGWRWPRLTETERRQEVEVWLERQRRNAEEDSPSWNGRRW